MQRWLSLSKPPMLKAIYNNGDFDRLNHHDKENYYVNK